MDAPHLWENWSPHSIAIGRFGDWTMHPLVYTATDMARVLPILVNFTTDHFNHWSLLSFKYTVGQSMPWTLQIQNCASIWPLLDKKSTGLCENTFLWPISHNWTMLSGYNMNHIPTLDILNNGHNITWILFTTSQAIRTLNLMSLTLTGIPIEMARKWAQNILFLQRACFSKHLWWACLWHI